MTGGSGPLDLTVGTLVATTNAGGIFLLESSALIIGGTGVQTTDNNAAIEITLTAGDLTLQDDITANGSGTVTLAVLGAGSALITAHTDVVGSLLRPSELLRAREKIAAGHITPVAFKEIEDRGLENVRIYSIDANDVIDLCLPDACLDRVMVFFPDPWHKKKHHKRRLIQHEFVQRVRHKLRVGGILHLATDWENYAEHMLEVMSESEGFANTQETGGYSPRPDDRPITKFEKRGETLGHGVWDLLFYRTN